MCPSSGFLKYNIKIENTIVSICIRWFDSCEVEIEHDTVTITDNEGICNLTEGGAVTRTGLRKKSARRTWSKSGFALMPVVLAEAGSSTGVGSNVSKGLLSLICVSTGTIRAEESTPKSGFLTSPNYPELYPNSHDSTQTIQVTEGKIIKITFTDFNTQHGRDTVEFVDDQPLSLSA